MTDPKKLAFDFGKEILGQSAGGLITKLAQHHKVTQNPANWYLVLHSIALAENAADPRQFIGGVLNGQDLRKDQRTVERRVRKATLEECKAFRAKFGYDMHCSIDEVPMWWRG